MNTSARLRVLVVDGQPLTRFALVTLMKIHPCFELCGEARNGPEAREMCATEMPDVVVFDVGAAGGNGVELLRELDRLHRGMRFVVVSDQVDSLSVARAFRAGVRAYVSKQEECADVFLALDAVIGGELFASHAIAHHVLEALAHPANEKLVEMGALSDRELQVFRLLGRKLGPKAIAQELGLSIKTVETHQDHLKAKLHAKNALELHRICESWAGRTRHGRRR